MNQLLREATHPVGPAGAGSSTIATLLDENKMLLKACLEQRRRIEQLENENERIRGEKRVQAAAVAEEKVSREDLEREVRTWQITAGVLALLFALAVVCCCAGK